MSGIPAGAGSLIGKRVGKYDILALLALGGTAEIYLARVGGAGGFEKYVVVKCLHDHLADDQDFVKMFLDEARLAAMLDHSNIVQTFELGEYENRYYMVMEFLAGLSLAMIVRRAGERLVGGLLPVPLVFNIAAQACAGLHYAHERSANGKPLNMVHRDISPQNLVISFEGIVKVVDFGIARAEMRDTKTKAGTIKGKFAYMSPEQCVATNVDRRTDVFALGVIVHELLTGRRLFKRNSPYETYQAVIECAVEPPSHMNNQIDPAIDPIVLRALAKDQDQRYPTAEAFGDALLGYLHHRGKGSGGAEISRFFEQYFAQEIEEHGERMRELISGHDFSVDTGIGWGEEDDKNANLTVDLGARSSDSAMSLSTGDIEPMRTGDPLLRSFDLDDEPRDDDELPVEKTRIEQNPLEVIQQLDAEVARRSSGKLAAPGRTPVPPSTVTSGPEPLPAPPSVGHVGARAVVGADSGRFPDLPNLPTAIAGDSSPPRHRPPNIDSPIATQPTASHPAQHPTPMMPGGPHYGMHASAPHGGEPHPQYGQPYPHPNAAMYPHATGPHPQSFGPHGHPDVTGPHLPVATGPHGQPQMQGPYPGRQSQPVFGDYPVIPGGQRPLSSDLAPSNLSSPQRSPYANAPFDPGAAASLMSPVGEQYPQTDWDRAAAMRAKTLPPWLLVALFVAALGGALLLTLVIAKIFT